MIELLRAIWQADSGFPSGSFAFSGGLEAFYALSEADATTPPALLHDMLALRWASSDRVALSRAHRASGALYQRPLRVTQRYDALAVMVGAGPPSTTCCADQNRVVDDGMRRYDGEQTPESQSQRPLVLDEKPDNNSLDAIAAADAALEAAILIQPLRDGSRRNGMALLAAHERLGTPGAARLRATCRDGKCLGHLAVMQGALFRAIGMDLPAAIAAAGYGAAAALVAAAVRLGRVGAIDGQRALSGVLPLLAHLAAHPPPPDAVPEAFLPLLDIAAARHARAAMRLFAT